MHPYFFLWIVMLPSTWSCLHTSTINKFTKLNSAVDKQPKVKTSRRVLVAGRSQTAPVCGRLINMWRYRGMLDAEKGEKKRDGALNKQKHSFSVTPFWEMWVSFLLKIKTDGRKRKRKSQGGIVLYLYSLVGLQRCQRGRNPVSEWFNHVWG